jgi:hypothetical protein
MIPPHQNLPPFSPRRRTVLTGMAAAFAHPAVLLAAPETKSMTDATPDPTPAPTYDSNGIILNNVAKFWPDKQQQPKLIVDIATLIAPWPWGALGYFYINGARANDYIVERGADLCQELGIFMGFANGSQYAVWYHDGAVAGAEPIVNIDDEGQFSVLAPNLHAFFTQWAQGHGIGMLEPFDYDAAPDVLADRRKKGDAILALIAASPPPPASPGLPAPDFYAFMENHGKVAFAVNEQDATLRAIAQLMDKHIPRGQSDGTRVSFDLKADGEVITITTSLVAPDYTHHAPLPEREALVPLLVAARNERAMGKTASLGKWTSAVLRLTPDGHVEIAASWE